MDRQVCKSMMLARFQEIIHGPWADDPENRIYEISQSINRLGIVTLSPLTFLTNHDEKSERTSLTKTYWNGLLGRIPYCA